MDIFIELLMYIFIVMGMITLIICIFEKQICLYLSEKYKEKDCIYSDNGDKKSKKKK